MNPPIIQSFLTCLAAIALGLPSAFAQTTERVSVSSAGVQGNNESDDSSISADGRYVAFQSSASNLVPGDTNGKQDLFVHDRQTGQTSRVSVDSAGIQGNGYSNSPSISTDGRYVAFISNATNLVSGDTNNSDDIFVHDRQTGQTSRVSVDSVGIQGNGSSFEPSISADGRYVAFYSDASNLVPGDTNGQRDVFVHDRQTDQTSRVSVDSAGVQGNFASWSPSISADGRFVAFWSFATNLVPGDTNGFRDVFVHDRQTGQTSRVSVDSAGLQGSGSSEAGSISADGRYVAFMSEASNLVPGDTNGKQDLFVHDRQTGQTSRVSVDSAGMQGNYDSNTPSISADGRFVAFWSYATNLVPGDTNGYPDVFVHDRQTGQTSRVSVDSAGGQGNFDTWGFARFNPSITADGRYVAFQSGSTNLVPGDTNGDFDVFVHDRDAFASRRPSAFAQTPERVSVSSAGVQGNRPSAAPSISVDGSYVAFDSYANNLVPGDTGFVDDVFVHNRQTGQTSRVSVDSAGMQGNDSSLNPSISADGRYVAFQSRASNLVPGDTNRKQDIFVHDLQTGQTSLVSVPSAGGQANWGSAAPSISADGRYVAFDSLANNLVPGDTNDVRDAFVHDRQTGQTSRVSVNSAGMQGNQDSISASISADGRYVAFESESTNLVRGDTNGWFGDDIFVHDRQTGQTSRVSVDSAGVQGNDYSSSPSISPDGRYVAFQSYANNLVPGDTNGSVDIFVHDRQTGQTSIVSVNSVGIHGDGSSFEPSISADGRYVAFESSANNLVHGDTNGYFDEDVFVHDRQTGQTRRVSVDSAGVQANNDSSVPSISADGRHVAFFSEADNLVPGDTNTGSDIFVVHDRQPIAPALAAQGSCPGLLTLTLDAVTPEGNVAFAIGAAGSFTLTSAVCAGTILDIANPRLGPVIRASWLGTIERSYSTTPAMCGLTVQAVDIHTCKTSNAVVL